MLYLYSELGMMIVFEQVEIWMLKRGKLFYNDIYNLPGRSQKHIESYEHNFKKFFYTFQNFEIFLCKRKRVIFNLHSRWNKFLYYTDVQGSYDLENLKTLMIHFYRTEISQWGFHLAKLQHAPFPFLTILSQLNWAQRLCNRSSNTTHTRQQQQHLLQLQLQQLQ